MRALRSHAAGGPETLSLDKIAAPLPGPGELRIAVRACGINFPDTLIVRDLYQYKPERPFSPGAEVAGVIDAVGEGVTRFKVGDRVAALLIYGGLAEQVVAEQHRVFALPDAVSFETGASLLLAHGTTLHALKDRAQLQPGETMLVLGAAGGTGLSAVELGKAMGARVIAAVSSEEKAEVARRAGADDVVLYGRPPFDNEFTHNELLAPIRLNFALPINQSWNFAHPTLSFKRSVQAMIYGTSCPQDDKQAASRRTIHRLRQQFRMTGQTSLQQRAFT